MTNELDNNNDIMTKVDDYIDVIETFCDVLSEENLALDAYDMKKVEALYERKTKIVSAYRALVAFFIKNSKALEELEDDIRIDLKEKSEQLDELLRENDLLLKTRMETSKSIMETIVNLAKITSNENSTSYGAAGNYSAPNSAKNAIAINRTL